MSRYIFQPYPSWRYHRVLPARIINGPDEEPGEGWSNTPATFLQTEYGLKEDAEPKKKIRKKESK